MWKSRIDKMPPAQYFADLLQHLRNLYPGATINESLVRTMREIWIAEWRNGQSAQDTAKATCSCDGKSIVPSAGAGHELGKRLARPPKGAKRGDFIAPDDLQEVTPLATARREAEKYAQAFERVRGAALKLLQTTGWTAAKGLRLEKLRKLLHEIKAKHDTALAKYEAVRRGRREAKQPGLYEKPLGALGLALRPDELPEPPPPKAKKPPKEKKTPKEKKAPKEKNPPKEKPAPKEKKTATQPDYRPPGQLPTVKKEGRTWFLDVRLRQARDTRNPHNYKDFETAQALLDWAQSPVAPKEKTSRPPPWQPPANLPQSGLAGNLSIQVEAVPNEDFATSTSLEGKHRATVRIPARTYSVGTLGAARALFRAFIEGNGLGGGNMPLTAGRVRLDGKPFACISYNGRIWRVDGKWKESRQELDESGQPIRDVPPKVGELVKFMAPGPHGPMKLAGTIERILPDGRLEVRSQNHGIHTMHPLELGHSGKDCNCKKAEPEAKPASESVPATSPPAKAKPKRERKPKAAPAKKSPDKETPKGTLSEAEAEELANLFAAANAQDKPK